MTREEPKFFLTDIRDFTTLFYVILRRKSSEWLQTSTESDWYAICNMEPGLSHSRFAFFKHCCYCKNRSLHVKRVFYLLIFVNRENEIVMSVSRHSLFFLFVNRARDPPPPPPLYDPHNKPSSTLLPASPAKIMLTGYFLAIL